MSSSGSVKLRYEKCLQVWGNAKGQVEAIESSGMVESEIPTEQEQRRIEQDTGISETERKQLVKARVGQGLFRSRVELVEPACRLTGVTDRRFLRASHMKPWAHSSNAEKLDGNNGLMLSPHVDHLFDKGYISFSDDGHLLVSNRLPQPVQQAWQLLAPATPRPFTSGQAAYLAYHRAHVFAG